MNEYNENKAKHSFYCDCEQLITLGLQYQLHGRQLELLVALSKEEVEQKAQSSEKDNSKRPLSLDKAKKIIDIIKLDKNEKRNLNLANAGTCKIEEVIRVGIFLQEMSDRDKYIREIHLQENLEKLKNPNHYVSDKSKINISHHIRNTLQRNSFKL